MRWPFLGAGLLLVLAGGDLLLYVSQDGMECQDENCSTVAEITGAVLYPLAILAVLLALAGAIRGLMGRARRES